MEKQNFLSKVLQRYISNKDIRDFKGNFFYYIYSIGLYESSSKVILKFKFVTFS